MISYRGHRKKHKRQEKPAFYLYRNEVRGVGPEGFEPPTYWV